LISNITHEFKTPIATVNSALEGIANFNQQNDQEKTAKYIDISVGQLKKLNLMVEKLLETATLESEALEIRKEPINLSQILHTLLEKYKMVAGDKAIIFHEHAQDVIIEADPFHIENAISNLIDNAIKYGGDKIEISLAHNNGKAQVVVNDNGGFIEKSQKERVFDKFYRIPTGNQHDVKGFGIGLYYTKKIIEKHGGTIQLVLKPQLTSFEVAIS
jgi:K+-sensing histidine kinase KdpD